MELNIFLPRRFIVPVVPIELIASGNKTYFHGVVTPILVAPGV